MSNARPRRYLEEAADRMMIQDLLGRYAWEIDHGTPGGWADLFTAEGVFEVPVMRLRVQGREQLVAFAGDLRRTLPNVHHVMSNFVIDLAGDRAHGRCELNEFLARPEGIYPNLQGWYEDDYVFEGECWRIDHRRVFVAEPRAGKSGRVGDYLAAFFEACEKYRLPRGQF